MAFKGLKFFNKNNSDSSDKTVEQSDVKLEQTEELIQEEFSVKDKIEKQALTRENTSEPKKENKIEEVKVVTTPKRDSNGKFVSKKPKSSPNVSIAKIVEETNIEPAETEENKVEEKGVKEQAEQKDAGFKEDDARQSKGNKPKGPFMVTFFGVEIRKYYLDGKWYFSLEDLLPLGQKDPPLGTLEMLNGKEEFNKIYKRVVTLIEEVPCSDASGSMEIARATKALFPGPFYRWIEETASFSYEEEPAPEEVAPLS